MYMLVKQLEEKSNIEIFTTENGFKKLLNLKSNKRKVADKAKTHFTDIVIKLIEDESALLEITENVIRKILFFKHDEEFCKEVKEKAKGDVSKKKSKDKGEKSKDSKDSKEEEKKEDLEQKESQVEETVKSQPLTPKMKAGKLETPLIKKSDISYSAFKNCSGVKLNQFLEQMKTIEAKASKVFLKACGNLCEIENIKEYDFEMNVKSEYKIIKLKDEVLKEYIAKVTKESSASHKNQPPNLEKKEKPLVEQPKSGSLTARTKQPVGVSLTSTSKKDNFLISSLMSAQNFFPKPNRNIILMLMDKIVDKFCNGNFENWHSEGATDDKEFDSQCIFSYSILLSIINKVIRTFPSTASLIMLFKSKKLKHFQSFIEFLVKKIYPIGFWKWSKYDPNSKEDLKKFDEFWKNGDIKDSKPENSREEDNRLYKVSWDKNSEWETVIVENMRTLIDYNIFMSPQEKKIKLEVKKHLLIALLDKTHKTSNQQSLRNVTTIATSLILLRKMLSVADSSQPL